MTVTEAIDLLGLRDQPVCIHASLRSFGYHVANLPESFLSVGCTILVPSFTDMFEAPPIPAWMPEQNGAGDYSYFFQKSYENCGAYTTDTNLVTAEEMGKFPQLILQRPERARGNNYLNSFTALGKHAHLLVRDQTNEDVYAPLRKLYELDGYVLLMGVDLSSATAIHYAEQVAGRKPFIRWSRNSGGDTIPVRAGGCSDGFEQLSPLLKVAERQAVVGNSLWRCWRMRDLVDICVGAIRKNPMITHCADPNCSRCNDAINGGPK